MQKIVITIFALVIGANHLMVSAQQADKKDALNEKMQKIAKAGSKPDFVKFKDDVKINPETVFEDKKSEFDLQENDKMVLYKIEKDELGFTLHKYQQYYRNVKVDGATFTVHTNKNGFTYAANGKLAKGLDVNVIPVINEKQAIDLALKHVNAKEYRWQSQFWENDLKERTGKPDTTYYPVPQLVIRGVVNKKTQSKTPEKQYFLAYRLDIYSSSPDYAQRIYIDANTGEVLQTIPLQSN